VLSFFTIYWLKQNQPLKKEFVDLQARQRNWRIEQLEKWDGGYYSEKLKQNYLILTTKIKALFPLEKVLNGAFTIAQNYMA
jgi:peptidyl-dipeptidase Dcp